MANSADPDQLVSSEANWSGFTLFEKGRVYPGSAGQGLTLVLLNPDIYPAFANSVVPDQLTSALFTIQYEFMSTTLIKQSDWLKHRSGRGIIIYSA